MQMHAVNLDSLPAGDVSTEAESTQLRRLAYVLAALVVACLLLAGVVWWQMLRSAPGPSDPREIPFHYRIRSREPSGGCRALHVLPESTSPAQESPMTATMTAPIDEECRQRELGRSQS